MKRTLNQVEDEVATSGLGQHIQALSKQIETLMNAQSLFQVPNSTPFYHTYDRCGCVHGPGECIVEGELA